MPRFLTLPLLLLGFAASAQTAPAGDNPRIGLGKSPTTTSLHIYCGAPDLTVKPLYIINGRVADSLQIASINPNQIKSISILKDAQAAEQYGDFGKNGVILIELKSVLIEK